MGKRHGSARHCGPKHAGMNCKHKVAMVNNLNTLKRVATRIRNLNSTRGHSPYYTVIDNGATQCLVGNVHWTINKQHNTWIGVGGFDGAVKNSLRLVDAYSTLLDESGARVAVIWLNQALYCPTSPQSLIAEDQLEHNGVEVHSRAKLFSGKQCIIAKHPKTAKQFKIPLGWDGSSKFLITDNTTKKDLKTLPHIHLTSQKAYDPNITCDHKKVNRMVTTRNRAFNWSRPDGRKFDWSLEQLAEWKSRLNFYNVERIKKTFQATTQLYPNVPHENEGLPKNFYSERFQALGAPYRMIRRNGETFSADIVPSVYRGKVKHKLVFSGLNSKFSAVYDMGYSKGATGSHLALQQFISDHGIPQTLITDGDQAENFSQKWIELCAKHFIEQHSSEAYKQNQNFVERWVQEAKTTITQIKQHTGCDDQYSFDMWSHVSDVNNHCARKSLKWRTPLEVFCGETPDLSIFRHAFFAPVWYREFNAKAGEIKMLKGRFMGIAWNVGDSLCMKILTVPDNPKKRGKILNRGVVCPRTPGVPFHEQMLRYPKDKFFPRVVEDNPSSIGGAGKQGAEKHVLEDSMGQPSAKRAKSNAGAVIQMTPSMQETSMVQGAERDQSEVTVHDDTCSVDSNTLEAV